MDLRQLSTLAAVGDHRSFSGAARALHTVQSNVSAHVAKLVAELGLTLIDRATCTLTDAGEQVVARARRIQAELDALTGDLASTANSVAGPVRLGMIGTTGRWLAPLLLSAVRSTHERVHLIIVDATTTSLIPQLHTGQLDLAVVNLPVDEADVATQTLFDEGHIVIAPADHPLSRFDRVDLAELSRHALLLPPRGTSFRDELDIETRRAGVELRAAAEVDGMRLLATLAFEGYGAAVLPASAAPWRRAASWRQVEIVDLAPRSVGLAWERRALPSTAARAVRDLVGSVVRERATEHAGIVPRAVSDSTHVGVTDAARH
jgi:LysR family hydrogen peroxide-inducible transcriptional activator